MFRELGKHMADGFAGYKMFVALLYKHLKYYILKITKLVKKY